MVYKEYHEYLLKLHFAEQDLSNYLDESNAILNMTQPHSPALTTDKVDGRPKTVPPALKYVMTKEEKDLYRKIEKAKNNVANRKYLVDTKKEELKKSNDDYDKVYVAKYIDNIKPNLNIGLKVNFSLRQINRILKVIDKELAIIRRKVENDGRYRKNKNTSI